MPSILTANSPPAKRMRGPQGLEYLNIWLPPLLAAAVIAIESTNTFSAAHTSRWLRPVAESLFGHISDRAWDEFHHLLRKCGHLTGYGLVCLTFLRAWLLLLRGESARTLARWRFRASMLAIASTAVIASLDEWHQTMLPSRTGMLSDVGIDVSGACLTCLLLWVLAWRRKGRAL